MAHKGWAVSSLADRRWYLIALHFAFHLTDGLCHSHSRDVCCLSAKQLLSYPHLGLTCRARNENCSWCTDRSQTPALAAETSSREMGRKEQCFRNLLTIVAGITAWRAQLLWDQHGAQLEKVHPWSFTAFPFKIKGVAYPFNPAFCYKLKNFSNSVMSVLLLRKIMECLVSGALSYPRLSSTWKGGQQGQAMTVFN